jgi:hypothetical protein
VPGEVGAEAQPRHPLVEHLEIARRRRPPLGHRREQPVQRLAQAHGVIAHARRRVGLGLGPGVEARRLRRRHQLRLARERHQRVIVGQALDRLVGVPRADGIGEIERQVIAGAIELPLAALLLGRHRRPRR